jgi:uncharacterized membrane protein YfcA
MLAMQGLQGLVLGALAAVGALFGGGWARNLGRLRREAPSDPDRAVRFPGPLHVGIGFITNFFDYLGIGSFATTTALFRALRLVPDQLIPGTLLIGHTAATLGEAFISIAIIEVEMTTLVLIVLAHMLGSWLGAGFVSRWPRRKIQLVMGTALLGAAALMLCKITKVLPSGGDTLGLAGGRLAIGLCGSFVIGALMTVGIGNFAPSLILFGLLGMNTRAIFPLMMGSCAFLMIVGSVPFMRRASYAPRPALGLALGGVPAVILAAYLVKELNIKVLGFLVVAAVVYTAASMLRSALKTPEEAR